jgi:hypothetical protein
MPPFFMQSFMSLQQFFTAYRVLNRALPPAWVLTWGTEVLAP